MEATTTALPSTEIAHAGMLPRADCVPTDIGDILSSEPAA